MSIWRWSGAVKVSLATSRYSRIHGQGDYLLYLLRQLFPLSSLRPPLWLSIAHSTSKETDNESTLRLWFEYIVSTNRCESQSWRWNSSCPSWHRPYRFRKNYHPKPASTSLRVLCYILSRRRHGKARLLQVFSDNLKTWKWTSSQVSWCILATPTHRFRHVSGNLPGPHCRIHSQWNGLWCHVWKLKL